MNLASSSLFPARSGTYVLVLRVPDPTQIAAGRLGVVGLPAGVYLYVGSAFGPGGLRARIGRHLRQDKALHWHIDYLTAAIPIGEVWFSDAPTRLECDWVGRLAALEGVSRPIPRFGASDCTCAAHLFLFAESSLEWAWEALERPTRWS